MDEERYEEEVTPEIAKAQADLALYQANVAMSNFAIIDTKVKTAEEDVEIARRRAEQGIANAAAVGGKLALFENATDAMIHGVNFQLQQLNEGHHDLNMALSETNQRLETLELMMQLQTTAPIAAATDAEAELVDQLITAESSLEATNNALDAALQLIHDIRKRARELGTMNTDEWTDLGQRSVAILELHKLI